MLANESLFSKNDHDLLDIELCIGAHDRRARLKKVETNKYIVNIVIWHLY